MRVLFLIALLAPPTAAAEAECANVPLCARLTEPHPVFFVGEAVAERQRNGRHPEYRFRIREALTGIAPGTEYAAVETGEGSPPGGLLLIQAHVGNDGALFRGPCDLALPDQAAFEAVTSLRRLHSADASLAIKLADARERIPGDARIVVDGPISRMADLDGRFSHLVPGAYRVTVSAPGYQTVSRHFDIQPGSCLAAEIRLTGTAQLAGSLRQSGQTVRLVDAGNYSIVSSAQADTQGRYLLVDVPPGRYLLSNGLLFYPGTPNRADASPIHLGPGAQVEVPPW